MNLIRYILLLVIVGLGRLLELRISRRHQQQLAQNGSIPLPEPGFRWMVMLHTGILAGSALEVWRLKRPYIRGLAIPMGILWALANGLRWWVIHSMGEHWNVQVIDSTRLDVVTRGPFRWIRHPNYLAVFTELVALPLIHSAWITAITGALAHIWVLWRRITLEEQVLMANPRYRALMSAKPRFLPRITL